MDTSTPTLLLTLTEAAVALHCGRTQAYALAAAGAIPTIRLGRSIRVPRSALLGWIEAGTRYPAEHGTATKAQAPTPRYGIGVASPGRPLGRPVAGASGRLGSTAVDSGVRQLRKRL